MGYATRVPSGDRAIPLGATNPSATRSSISSTLKRSPSPLNKSMAALRSTGSRVSSLASCRNCLAITRLCMCSPVATGTGGRYNPVTGELLLPGQFFPAAERFRTPEAVMRETAVAPVNA